MKEIILAKYGEIILKGGNRPKFENILMNNIRNSLKNVAEVKARLAQATICSGKIVENIRYCFNYKSGCL